MTGIFEEHSVSDLVSVLFDGFVNGFDAVSGGVGHGLLYGNAANGGYGGNGHGVYGGRGHRVGQWSVTEVVQWIVSARCVSQSRVERCSSSDGHQSGEDNHGALHIDGLVRGCRRPVIRGLNDCSTWYLCFYSIQVKLFQGWVWFHLPSVFDSIFI